MKWWKKFLQSREVERRIPGSYNWYMNSQEREMWITYGWRVKYWVCPTCGSRRDGCPKRYLPGGWSIPARTCNCDRDT